MLMGFVYLLSSHAVVNSKRFSDLLWIKSDVVSSLFGLTGTPLRPQRHKRHPMSQTTGAAEDTMQQESEHTGYFDLCFTRQKYSNFTHFRYLLCDRIKHDIAGS